MIKNNKLLLFVLCLFILSIFTTACGGGGKSTPPSYPFPIPTPTISPTPEPTPTPSPTPEKYPLKLSQTEFTLNIGETDNITVTLNGEDITQIATYTVDQEAIASVEQGVITGLSVGVAIVTVHSDEAEADKIFTVNVIDPSLPTLEASPSEVNLGVIDETTVKITLEGKDVTEQVDYKSDEESIATAEKGKITAGIVEGTAKIAVSISGANSAIIKVNVTDDTDEEVTLDKDVLDQLYELGYIAKDSANKAELTEANIPAIFKYNDKKYKITSIADYLFQNCSALTIITIPDTVTTIGQYAFYNCTLLESIIIPDLVTYIDSGTFSNCSSLTNVNIGDGVLCIFPYSFYNCDKLTKITTKSGTINIESGYYKNNNITFIYVKQDQSNVTGNIEIPNGVTKIPDYAFYTSSGLTSITIPDSVTSIGQYAFYKCTLLESIIIPDSVTSIDQSAFYNCTLLESITIPDSVTSINTSAFANCGSLETVNLGKGITKIPDYAFYKCQKLKTIAIPDGVTIIDSYSFKECSKLETVNLGNTVTTVGSGAFYDCQKLETITIPDGVLCIFPNALKNTEVTKLTTTQSETINIENGYYKNNNVTFIYVGEDPNKVTGEIEIPTGVTEIPYAAFYNIEDPLEECSGLKSITIPNSVTSIGQYAFCNCTNSNLSIAIPNSVTIIGYYAFKEVAEITYNPTQMTATGTPWGAKKVN